MSVKILFVTPPFTQLNTPYPATAYLKGFLNTKNISSAQADLGIEVILKLFSKKGLQDLFARLEALDFTLDENTFRIYSMREDYIQIIEAVVCFLQNKNPTLAHSICDRTFLPEAARFAETEDLDWAFGTMGIQDKARHLATLYLEDLGDLIKATIDPHFGFSRYAERLGRTATHFDELHRELNAPNTYITCILEQVLEEKIIRFSPEAVGLSVPFPGNLFGALKCAQFIKQHHPHIKVLLGGGYANTELRSLHDARVFNYIDYVCLDDGEAAIVSLLEHIDGKRTQQQLKRVFLRQNNQVVFCNAATEPDVAMKDSGTPDYSDLPLDSYISVIEVANPMHRLWSDGRWNKLTLAHGCYWGRCSFCDISLDYIKRYEPLTAALICDRIEKIIEQTGQNGFHFVDEAAPPNLLREVALEIIRRKIVVSWWTNIRFEKLFTPDLSRLLKASGCIAVAGGLEVASDRLLTLMKKGVTVAQVAQVADGFTRAGIMVHAYLMYGFPTQTAQETIDALEMVRQLFENGVLQSGFWHRFAMTAHSPVGIAPAKFNVEKVGPDFGGFADNDLYHDDPQGANHDLFADGLRKSLFNYMHGVCFDYKLQEWFDFKVPKTSIAPHFIEDALNEGLRIIKKQNITVVWLGKLPEFTFFETAYKGKKIELAQLEFYDKKKSWEIQLKALHGKWLQSIFPQLLISHQPTTSLKDVQEVFEKLTNENFEDFMQTKAWFTLRENGLLLL
jgi:hypothetical protein